MDKNLYMFLMIVAMAVVTYLIRVIPMLLFKRKIKSPFVNSLLYYLPYAVLSAMTFPFILYSSGHIASAIIGTAIALFAAIKNRSMVLVALLACAAVLLCELFIVYVI